ncbi:hypothetical protein [Curtobacterium sp. 9128]|uniref:hypothetical protein n=1 Tax=Curtobacterium sp. 9128 TaxID=1793722 RepID=UPI00119E64AC|nr:hypothetical protein [Curtobacterium sp. 9128]
MFVLGRDRISPAGYAPSIGWWIGAAVVFVALVVFSVWVAKFTDFGARSWAVEQSDQELADALREAQANFYHHR